MPYPAPVGNRLAYDTDGSAGFSVNHSTGVITSLTSAEVKSLNDETSSGPQTFGATGEEVSYGVIFPESRDLDHFYLYQTLAGSPSSTPRVQVSSDTTNGQDGTWTTLYTASGASVGDVPPDWRSNAVTLTGAGGVRAVRVRYHNAAAGMGTVYHFHVYGVASAASDRLEFWHPTINISLAGSPGHFDWGDSPRGGGPFSRQFRIKNVSSALTANTIVLSVDEVTAATPTVASQTLLSYNGGAYDSTAIISALAPGAISQLATVKYTPVSGAQLGVWTQRYLATPGSWT